LGDPCDAGGGTTQALCGDFGGSGWNQVNGSGGSGAPTGAQYLVLALDAGLSGERDFTLGFGLGEVDAGANGAYTLSLDLSDAGTDPVWSAGQCRWSNEGASAAGWVCEGETPDAHETRFRVVDPTAERIVTFPNANSATAVGSTCSGTDKFSAFDPTTGLFTCDTDEDSSGGSPVVLDLDDDGLDESTNLEEIATVGDDYDGVSEPAPDKALITPRLIEGEDRYQSDGYPDYTCPACEEWTDNVDGNNSNCTLTHDLDAAVWTCASTADTNRTEWRWTEVPGTIGATWGVFAKIDANANSSGGLWECGIGTLTAGTTSSPTEIYSVGMRNDGNNTLAVFRRWTAYGTAATTHTETWSIEEDHANALSWYLTLYASGSADWVRGNYGAGGIFSMNVQQIVETDDPEPLYFGYYCDVGYAAVNHKLIVHFLRSRTGGLGGSIDYKLMGGPN
jgi:hypothetical protein